MLAKAAWCAIRKIQEQDHCHWVSPSLASEYVGHTPSLRWKRKCSALLEELREVHADLAAWHRLDLCD